MRFTGTFVVVAVLFITVLITSNIIVVKPVRAFTLPFEFLGGTEVVFTGAILIFPLSYIIGDVLTEVYGFRVARGVIWLGFAANLLVVTALGLTAIVPGAGGDFWSTADQGSYERILGQLPGILVASFVAYLVGEFSNSTVLALLKYKMQGRLLFVRTIGSTMVGQGLDSFIFIFLAFGVDWDGFVPVGVFSENTWAPVAVLGTALAQWVAKTLYETLATPLTYLVVGYMKRKEEMDVTDVPRSLNPLGIFA